MFRPRNLWNFDMNACPDTRSEIGWTSKHISKMFVPHDFVAVGFQGIFEFSKAVTPPGKDFLHVVVFLHRDNPHMVLLINPNEEIFIVVMPDTSSVRPITSHTG